MYTVGDFLIQIKNAYMANKKTMEFPFSKMVFSIGKILEKEGYLGKVAEKTVGNKKTVSINLKYENKFPAISEINLVSKPSIRRYFNKSKMRKASFRHGIAIVSTSLGVMTNKQAIKEGVGGEVVCQIY